MRTSARLRLAAAVLAAAVFVLPGTVRAAPPTPTPTPTPASTPAPLSAVGTMVTPDGVTRLTDSSGRVLDLRGFNLDKYDESTPADIQAIAEHGFNLIRLDITWARLEPKPGVYDAAAMGRIQQLMTAADRYGLRVLVDFHQDVYGPYFGGGQDGIPAWATRDDGLPFTPIPNDWFSEYFEPSVQAAFRHLYDDPDLRAAQASFYQHVATALRSHPSLLGYDLFNEPSGPMLGNPSDPAALAASSRALEQGRLQEMYKRLITAVRAVDQRSWLFVEPTVLVGEGVPTALPGFVDPRAGAPRIGYAPHFYDTAVEDGQDWNPADGFIDDYLAAITAYPKAHGMPVIVGEWGENTSTPGNAALMAAQVRVMPSFATGWTRWYWGLGTGGYAPLDAAGNPLPGEAPMFAPFASALAGTPAASTFDANSGTYTLTYTPGANWLAPTEIVLPGTVYGDNVAVSVSGGRAATFTIPPTGPGKAGRALVFAAPAARHQGSITVTVRRR
ncbi:cellulase family glycosylhydrolase [Catenulispora pinisilvae]|uniref:cellulase family glycosylhydrolase n=1 Tax=Catenulispora pinisilvae TaxID=2705253 RepID=UPI0018923509|nr:cellulase family glycosylhydrolase [Catenulispora pinisilvae]